MILIEADKKILVDTGFENEMLGLSSENVERNRKNLISELEHYGYLPDDIEVVFITHWHLNNFKGISKTFGLSESRFRGLDRSR